MKKQIKRKIYLLSKRESRPIEVVQYETGVQLVFEVQDIVLDETATATLFVRKPSGKFVFQEDNISLTGNTVVIDLHNQAITEHGHPFFQIKFKKGEEVISTYSGMLTVETSLEDSGAEESKTVIAAFDKFTDAQIARIEEATRSQIDLMKAEVEAKGLAVLSTIPDEYTEMYNRVNTLFNSVANAIKGTVSGSVVRVDDVSPVEHTPVVKVRGKNLIPYPYRNTTQTLGGVTFTDNGNGGVSMEGTSTGGCNFYFTDYNFSMEKGKTYTFSLSGDFTATANFDFWIYSNELQKGIYLSTKSATSKTFIADENYTNAAIYFVVGKGTQISGTVYPMVEEGDTATEYTSYIDPSTVTVKEYGKNLFPVNEITLAKTNAWGLQQMEKVKLAHGVYTAKCEFKQIGLDKSKVALSIRDYDDAIDTLASANSDETSGVLLVTFEVAPKRKGIQIYLYSNNTANVLNTECVFTDLQLESGENATDFEGYITPKSYTPEANGTCDIVTVSPTMTLLTDTEGVTIECEYIKDTGKVIDNLTKAVVALGGVV